MEGDVKDLHFIQFLNVVVSDSDVLHVRMKDIILHHANRRFVVQEDCHRLIEKLVIIDLTQQRAKPYRLLRGMSKRDVQTSYRLNMEFAISCDTRQEELTSPRGLKRLHPMSS
jgi:hypothetical protein